MIFIHLFERKRERDRRKVRKKKDEERKGRKEDCYVPGYGLSIEKQSAFQELIVYGKISINNNFQKVVSLIIRAFSAKGVKK